MSFLRSLYLTRRFFVAGGGIVLLFVLGYLWPPLVTGAQVGLVALGGLLALDLGLLYRNPGIGAERETPDRLSNGDNNLLRIRLRNSYPFPVRAVVIDELPVQFQIRDARFTLTVPPGHERILRYTVRPVKRGSYAFGTVNVFAASPMGLVQRCYAFDEGREVPVYPSFVQMRNYELMALSNRLEEVGVKKVRRVGHTMEFDHIREYVVGDDYRTINWKATARRGDLMVNQYRDERAQPVYCVVNMGRVMEMPFDGMTLLDYSINASLVLSNIALLKQDRAGLITFSHEIGPVVPAERRSGQIRTIQERLYKLSTDFLEADYARLAAYVRSHIRRRGLLILFTNFMTRASMERQLPYLQMLARHHTVVVVFFENTEVGALIESKPERTEEIYIKTIGEKFAFEKREIVREFRRRGLYAVLTPPEELSVQTINKYLELKARGVV